MVSVWASLLSVVLYCYSWYSVGYICSNEEGNAED